MDGSATKLVFEPYANDQHLANPPLRKEKLNFDNPAGKQVVVLVACGAFSPPSIFHLRLMEDARDALIEKGYHVAGGFLSPVHIKYGKKSLVTMHHRVNMVGHALEDSDWLQVDAWECAQEEYTRTADVLEQRFQRELSSLCPGVRVMLACGGDLLESFIKFEPDGTPVWSPAHQEIILGQGGVVCMTREGTDLDKVIKDDALLSKYQANIVVFMPAVHNNISSTLVRNLLLSGRSLKYLVHEGVRNYIMEHDLASFKAWGGTGEPSSKRART